MGNPMPSMSSSMPNMGMQGMQGMPNMGGMQSMSMPSMGGNPMPSMSSSMPQVCFSLFAMCFCIRLVCAMCWRACMCTNALDSRVHVCVCVFYIHVCQYMSL